MAVYLFLDALFVRAAISTARAMKAKPSADFSGYWQRHIKAG
jgi:hypothetical protein